MVDHGPLIFALAMSGLLVAVFIVSTMTLVRQGKFNTASEGRNNLLKEKLKHLAENTGKGLDGTTKATAHLSGLTIDGFKTVYDKQDANLAKINDFRKELAEMNRG